MNDDGVFFAACCNGFEGEGCETKVWDRRNLAEPFAVLVGHTQSTLGCAFGGAGQRYLLTVSQDATLRAWDWRTAQQCSSVTLARHGGFTGVCAAGEEAVLSATFAGGLQRWHVDTQGGLSADRAVAPPGLLGGDGDGDDPEGR